MTLENLKSGRNDITFKSQGLDLAAHLYTPEGFDPSGSYPAIVFSSAFNQVKEQTAAVYGPEIAKRGYVMISFDHIGYGDSPGELCNNENSFIKMESIRDAISFAGTLPFVDRENLFGTGVCASGGYMALVATTDKRLKAIASVSGMMANQASYFGAMDRETVTAQTRSRKTMKRYHDAATFCAGPAPSNVAPHFASGVSGNRLPSPFAHPSGAGMSSPEINAPLGLTNLFLGHVFPRPGTVILRAQKQWQSCSRGLPRTLSRQASHSGG